MKQSQKLFETEFQQDCISQQVFVFFKYLKKVNPVIVINMI